MERIRYKYLLYGAMCLIQRLLSRDTALFRCVALQTRKRFIKIQYESFQALPVMFKTSVEFCLQRQEYQAGDI